MEDQKINFAADFRINEQLHELSQELAAGYGMLDYHYPNDTRVQSWKETSQQWGDYEDKLAELSFDSLEQAKNELTRLEAELRKFNDLKAELEATRLRNK